MRADSEAAEDVLHRRCWTSGAEKLRAPIISVVGSARPGHRLLRRALPGVAVPQRHRRAGGAGRGRALLPASTGPRSWPRSSPTVHPSLGGPATPRSAGPDGDAGWRARAPPRAGAAAARRRRSRPSMARFVGVTAGQLVSTTGSALTAFAVPIWLYTRTGSVADLGLLWALALLCGVLTLPVAGARGRPGRPAPGHDRGQSAPGRRSSSRWPCCCGPATCEVWHVYLLLRAGVGGRLVPAAGVPVGDAPAGAEAATSATRWGSPSSAAARPCC